MSPLNLDQPVAEPPRAGLVAGLATGLADLGSLELESGRQLERGRLAWRSWGTLSPRGDNAVLVCHALTGTADLDQWWPALLGPRRAFDPRRDFVIAANVLGGCAGSSGPCDPAPDGARWGSRFPAVTIRDQVAAEAVLLRQLGVERVALVVGASMGGMRALEWLVDQPLPVSSAVVIAAPAAHSPWAIGISAAQRAAIEADPRWSRGRYAVGRGPRDGLAAARRIAMLSYRSWPSVTARFGRVLGQGGAFAVEEWLDHHGRSLVERFDAASYHLLTRAMDSHDVGRGRSGVAEALGRVRTPALVLGVSSDALYPLEEVAALARQIPSAMLDVLESSHGHDAFLIEAESVGRRIDEFRRRVACLAA